MSEAVRTAVLLLTGGSRGIGEAIALQAAQTANLSAAGARSTVRARGL
jgi:NAD(P)-dependent dehydrogenase (short-subunit alcohol dehydrogenase family)